MSDLKCYRCSAWPCECRDNVALICGDNCDVMGQLPKESVDLVVTSPPYDDLRTYGGHSWDFYGVAWQLKRLLKPGGVIVWVVADATKDGSESGSSMRQALHFQSLGLNLHDTMIWHKQNAMPLNSVRYEPATEYMFVFSSGKPGAWNPIKEKSKLAGMKNTGTQIDKGGNRVAKWGNGKPYSEIKVRQNIWSYPVGGGNGKHPAIFPEDLARDHILSWSNPCDLVLDPFNGSGTTTKMAKATGRRAIGIEVNEEYLPIAANRLRQEVLQFTE